MHIEYSTYQFSEESKGRGGPCGTEKSVVLRGLSMLLPKKKDLMATKLKGGGG